MKIALIVAVADNGVIGDGKAMPWHLPRDLAYFKKTTLGCPVIMGRKTFDSILAVLGKPLPGRANIVVSRNPQSVDASKGERLAVASLPDALAQVRSMTPKPERIFVIGGGEIYTQAMLAADELFVTHVHTNAAGTVLFPTIDPAKWTQTKAERVEADANNPFAVTFAVYEAKRTTSATH
jgi:dihydrofolate reductase